MHHRIDWHSLETVVQTRCSDQIEIGLGTDVYIPLQDYIDEHGLPEVNGKGHSRCTWMNETCVLVPAKRVWEVKRRRLHEVSKTTTQNSSHLAFDAQQLDTNFSDLSLSMFAAFPKAGLLMHGWQRRCTYPSIYPTPAPLPTSA
jgi:hypothetical protein